MALGQNNATFTAATGVVNSNQNVTITGTLNAGSQTFVLALGLLNPVLISGLSCSPAMVPAPGPATCTVTLAGGPAANGITISLSSSDARVTVPASVPVNAGQASATFAAFAAADAGSTVQLAATLNSSMRTFDLGIQHPAQTDVLVTVTSNPPGLTVSVDNVNYSTPFTFDWRTGSTHTLDVRAVQTVIDVPFMFNGWSNGGSQSQTITVSEASTISANFSAGKIGVLAHVVGGGAFTTGIRVLNDGASTAQFSIRFYDDQGNPLTLPFTNGSANLLSGAVPPWGSVYYETGTTELPIAWGSGRIVADPSIAIQALFRNNVNGSTYEAAVPFTQGGKEFVIPFDATRFNGADQPVLTAFAVANLEPTPATVTCTAHNASGATIPNAITVPALAPRGHWADYRFPALDGLQGTITCVSNAKISATALRFLGAEFSSLPVVTNPADATGRIQTGAIAEVVAGGGYTTGIFFHNTGTTPAPFSIQFYDDQGKPMALPFATGSATKISGTLPAQGSAYYEANAAQNTTITGSGQSSVGDSIVIQTVLRRNVNGTFDEAAVPYALGSREFVIPFDSTTVSGMGELPVTALAIANLDLNDANVRCVARDNRGIEIPNAIAVPTLAPQGHWADYRFPVLDGQRGTIACVSDARVSAAAFRFLGSGFSSQPVIAK